ncbi:MULTISPECIES: glutathione peroxidase [Sphingobacterium]|uniref:glutathione peroxidase n=1 Tax=Sphingobacterium TaxID=28453 RepID=UPI0013DC66EF|nr:MULTISPECIES: glutathione peroxidase [unclassified Sphingobacterium]
MKSIISHVFIVATLLSGFSCNGQQTKSTETKTIPTMNTSFYNLSVTLNNGEKLNFSSLKGKKVLLVNTASKCGYTKQYEDLEKLSKAYKDKLMIIAFPANDFANQENGSDEEIAQFCKSNYGVTFPIAKKAGVIKNAEQQEVFKWLSDKQLNGWNDQEPEWNFSKYLISEDGQLLHYFKSSVAPLDQKMIDAIDK